MKENYRFYNINLKYFLISIYIIFTIIFLNAGLETNFKYQITIAVIYPFVFLMLNFRSNYNKILILIFILLWPILNYFAYYSINNKVEFLKSYLLYFHFSISLFIIININVNKKFKYYFSNALFIALFIVVIFSLVQYFGTIILRRPLLYNIFGKYQIGGIQNTARFVSTTGLFRSSGFYWEPSTNALVVFTISMSLYISKYRYKNIALILNGISMISIQSSTGIISFLVILIVIFYFKSKRIIIKNILIISLIVALYIVISSRFNEFKIPGSSGYYRWILPLIEYSKYIIKYPLGLVLGQFSFNLDNGVFVALIYSGVFGVIFVLNKFKNVIINIINKKNSLENFLFYISIMLSLIFNGAFLTPEMSFLLEILFLNYKSNEIYE